MSCSSCARANTLLTCLEEIVIATVGLGDYDIYFKNLTLGKLYRQTLDGVTELVIDITALPVGALMPEHEYEIWATAKDAGPDAKLDLTFGMGSGAVEADCVSAPFIDAYNGNEEHEIITSQQIVLNDEQPHNVLGQS